jgi:anthranilate/para-aminobenzoate synthase component I
MHAQPFELSVPLSVLARRLRDVPGLCWLDGEAAHADGRYSFLGAEPCERVTAEFTDGADVLAACARLEPHGATDELAYDVIGAPQPADVPRWIGYVAYDACNAPRRTAWYRDAAQPALYFARYDALLAIDHLHGAAFLVGDDAAACERLRALLSRDVPIDLVARASAVVAAPEAQHRVAIARALEAIAAGDVYQVNLARSFHAAFEGAPLALWLALRAASPVPLGCYLDDGARVIMARTMERFLRFRRAGRSLLTRPIKGTIARAGDRDAEEARALRGDAKERAEHAMIVDLMRNDLGRVAEIGSVHVPEWMAVEPFAGLSHLVSTVACRTRADVTLRELLGATFPPGSVTGTPKLRAVELIAELEPEPRGVYTGAVGFVDRAGGLSLAVAIRTAVVGRGRARHYARGGLGEASDVERELAETELKARAFRDALGALPGCAPVRLVQAARSALHQRPTRF